MIAKIVFSIALHKTFDYVIPELLQSQIKVGARVEVPFGTQKKIGIVTEITNVSEFDRKKLKPISDLLDVDSLFTADLWTLLNWATRYYHYPLGEVLFHALPILLRKGRKLETLKQKNWKLTKLGQEIDLAALKNAKKQQAILQDLKQGKPIALTAAQAKPLIEKGWIEAIWQEASAIKPWLADYVAHPSPLILNQEQEQAIEALQQAQDFTPFFLEGITGSGKTEVYLNAIAPILAKGKQVLVLVPEIGLTPQTMKRFQDRFQAPIAMLHSQLTDKVRLEIWQKIKSDHIAIVIGTRSALFSPFVNLGLIIVDEEHDHSYKQQEGFRYHARDLAVFRAKLNQIPIVLGSATPSFETIHNADQNRYRRLKLTQRAGSGTLVQQSLLDIRGLPLIAGISMPLMQAMEKELAKDHQVLLFLNRRGFSPTLMCHDCGWIAECPRCDLPFSYHQKQARLICHHCDCYRAVPNQCIECGSTHLMPVGVGTEQIEATLRSRFPDVPIVRLDRDTTQKKEALNESLTQIAKGGKQILIGTQIIAKGHHFPDVTLVGIIDVDGALYSSQFKSTEQFAQLYTQVSGRAGREEKKGRVILQTHHPEHSMLLTLLHKGYLEFAQANLKERQSLLLPPFAYHAILRVADKDNQSGLLFLQQTRQLLQQIAPPDLLILGPSPAAQIKKAGYFLHQILLQQTQRAQLQTVLNQLVTAIETDPRFKIHLKRIKWILDVDPIFY